MNRLHNLRKSSLILSEARTDLGNSRVVGSSLTGCRQTAEVPPSDRDWEVGKCSRMCPLLPVRGLLGMPLDENRAPHELRLQLPDGRQYGSSQFPEITPD